MKGRKKQIVSINETFTKEEHSRILKAKERKAREIGFARLSWHDYLIEIARESER